MVASCGILYWLSALSSLYTGSGYATEAVRAFLPVVTRLVGIDQIESICLKENAASIRVMEKCSFRQVFNGPGE